MEPFIRCYYLWKCSRHQESVRTDSSLQVCVTFNQVVKGFSEWHLPPMLCNPSHPWQWLVPEQKAWWGDRANTAGTSMQEKRGIIHAGIRKPEEETAVISTPVSADLRVHTPHTHQHQKDKIVRLRRCTCCLFGFFLIVGTKRRWQLTLFIWGCIMPSVGKHDRLKVI